MTIQPNEWEKPMRKFLRQFVIPCNKAVVGLDDDKVTCVGCIADMDGIIEKIDELLQRVRLEAIDESIATVINTTGNTNDTMNAVRALRKLKD